MDFSFPSTEGGCDAEIVIVNELFQAAFNAATDTSRSRAGRIEAYSWRDAAGARRNWLIAERNRQHAIEFTAGMRIAARRTLGMCAF